MSGRGDRRGPLASALPVVVACDVVLLRTPGLAVWAGAVTVFPNGFSFTLLSRWDAGRGHSRPTDWAMDSSQRARHTWLEIQYPGGRWTGADLNDSTQSGQRRGPYLRWLDGEARHRPEGWDISRWWVSPLPPAAPLGLIVHLSGEKGPTAQGSLDGAVIVRSGAQAEVVWA